MGARSRNRTLKPLVVDPYAPADQQEVIQPQQEGAAKMLGESSPEEQLPDGSNTHDAQPETTAREIIDVDATGQDTTQQKMPTAAYVRLSVENGGHGREDTLETQIDLVHEYIHRQPDLELYDTYVDNGISGQTFDRPQFERMMEDVSRGRVKCIVVKDLSRFGRDYLETGTYVEKIFPLLGVRLISVNDNFDSTRPGDVDGLTFPMKNLVNEMYAKDIGKKIRTHYEMLDREGKILGNRPPYGYIMQKDGDDRRLVPDEETAGYVRVIFYWHQLGLGLEEVSKRLELAGIPTPYQHNPLSGESRKDEEPEKWTDRTLRQIIVNQTYTGDTVTRRFSEGWLNPREEWHVTPDTHEALISHEDFEKSWKIYEKSKRETKEGNTGTRKLLFYRKIYCGACGSSFHFRSGDYKDGTHRGAYRCSNRNCINSRSTVNEEVFKILIMDQIRVLLRAACDYRKLAKELMSEDPTRGKAGSIRVRLTNGRVKLKQNEERTLKAYEDYAEGVMGREDYVRLKEQLAAEKKKTESAVRALEAEEYELKGKAGRFLKITEDFEEYLDVEGYPEELVDRLVEKIEYYPDGGIKLTLKCADVYGEMMKFLDTQKEQKVNGSATAAKTPPVASSAD